MDSQLSVLHESETKKLRKVTKKRKSRITVSSHQTKTSLSEYCVKHLGPMQFQQHSNNYSKCTETTCLLQGSDTRVRTQKNPVG